MLLVDGGGVQVSDAMGAVFKGADLDTQVVALTRQVGGAEAALHQARCAACAA